MVIRMREVYSNRLRLWKSAKYKTMKKWYEKDPVKHGLILLTLFGVLDVADARWFIPHIRPVCNGEITDQQSRICSGWIKTISKERSDVRVTKRRFGGSGRYPETDANDEWIRTLESFGGK